MNAKQKSLLIFWAFCFLCFCILGYLMATDSKYFEVAEMAIVITATILFSFQDVAHYKGYGANSGGLGEFVEDHPLIKYWSIIYCLLFLPFIVYKLAVTGTDNGWLIAFAIFLLMGPIILVSEVERYKSLGE